MLALSSLLLAVPGANYVVIAGRFVAKYWKPLALAAALFYSFHLGVKHERKKNDVAQYKAQILKLTAERDNMKTAADLAASQVKDLEERVKSNDDLIEQLRTKPPEGDCTLSDDALRRLRSIGPSRR